jgi:hypothetical protein
VVAGETILPDAPAAQLAPAARFEVVFASHGPEIIRAFYKVPPLRLLRTKLAVGKRRYPPSGAVPPA